MDTRPGPQTDLERAVNADAIAHGCTCAELTGLIRITSERQIVVDVNHETDTCPAIARSKAPRNRP